MEGYAVQEELLRRLRAHGRGKGQGLMEEADGDSATLLREWSRSGVAFAASSPRIEQVYTTAVAKLSACIRPVPGPQPVLQEGGVYYGCWLESTGTMNAEVLARYMPQTAQATMELFADYQRADGLMPYKLASGGPAFRQIQLVTPLARSVWNHLQLQPDEAFLRKLYGALSRQDRWLAAHRNTRGTGCVEAFSTFDTGHDLSPRFWHAPDAPYRGDPARCDPDSPVLPYLAPDLTAHVYCQRLYLAKMAEALGESGTPWRELAGQSLDSLYRYCYDETDGFFYDVDRHGELVRVQSDALLRVLACEVGDGAFFASSLKRYLLNTTKFFAKFPFTSLAMDDPRFDPSSSYNTWGGTTNFLSLLRAPQAFEHHERHVELTWVMQPILNAAARFTRFPQALSPWTGEEGYTDTYSPAILCVLDYIERLCGILPAAQQTVWFTGLLPTDLDHGEEIAHQLAYSRIVDGVCYEQVNDGEQVRVLRDGRLHLAFPCGIRVVTDRHGRLQRMIGMTIRTIQGQLLYEGRELPFMVKGNEQLAYAEGQLMSVLDIGVVTPAYR